MRTQDLGLGVVPLSIYLSTCKNYLSTYYLPIYLSLSFSLRALGFRAVRAHPPARERAAASLWRMVPPGGCSHRGLGFTLTEKNSPEAGMGEGAH